MWSWVDTRPTGAGTKKAEAVPVRARRMVHFMISEEVPRIEGALIVSNSKC